MKFWACRPKRVTYSAGQDERFLSFWSGLLTAFLDTKEQSLYPVVTVPHLFFYHYLIIETMLSE